MKENLFVVVHYDEIALKGKNRFFFEKKLKNNISFALKGHFKKLEHKHDKMYLELNNQEDSFLIGEKLKNIPGIAYFAFARACPLELFHIKQKTLEIMEERNFSTFRVSARRSNKKFPHSSQEINEEIGALIVSKMQKKVKLKGADEEIFIEIGSNKAFIYPRKTQGVGGLPVGSSGKVLSSLSGGIDSPVASFMAMKRGLKVVFVHIFNKSINEVQTISKVENLTKKLSEFQGGAKLYIVPFEEIQKVIIATIPSEVRMIIYRRFMFRILNNIALREKAKGFVTGDSLGQVASQTLENLNCIHKIANFPVLSPLIGMNKNEIIEIARKIGTFEESILPYGDCCSFMVARHPETKGKIEKIERFEELIENVESLIDDCVEKAEIRWY